MKKLLITTILALTATQSTAWTHPAFVQEKMLESASHSSAQHIQFARKYGSSYGYIDDNRWEQIKNETCDDLAERTEYLYIIRNPDKSSREFLINSTDKTERFNVCTKIWDLYK